MSGFAIRLLTLGVLFVPIASSARAESATFLVDDFNDQVQNALGGYRNTFAAEPSSAAAMRVADIFRGAVGRSARIEARRGAKGYCGYWIHMFDMRAEERRYFDASAYSYLSLWVRGARGGEDFLIKLADQRWIEKEDSVTVGRAAALLPEGVTTEWQEVVIPIGRQPLNWRRLGGITFEFTEPGRHVVYIDDIAFKQRPAAATPGTKATASHRVESRRELSRRLWVWSTETLLNDAGKQTELFEFCHQHRIGELWTQLLYSVDRGDDSRETQCTIRDPEKVRTFLRAAHESEILVHALDGYADFALRENHDIPLAVVDAVVAFNRDCGFGERFAGVHFDNEPYLLVGWQDPNRREQILQEFLELNAECQRRIHERSQMRFGIDIPFWWQERDERTGKVVGEVEFRGKRQAASYHCLDLLDNVGVMNYRDTADGADGMIAHGRNLLEYADKSGRATVYMGVETFRYRPSEVWFVCGLPREQFHAALGSEARHIARVSRLNEFRLRTLDDGQRVHVGIELPDGSDSSNELVTKTMRELAQHFSARELIDNREVLLQQVRDAIAKDHGWTNLEPRAIRASDGQRPPTGFTVDSVMLSKITFADDSFQDFQTQVRNAEEFFGRYKRYGGTAIHFYETFRDKARGSIPIVD
jgi:hypothetical protein